LCGQDGEGPKCQQLDFEQCDFCCQKVNQKLELKQFSTLSEKRTRTSK